MVARYAVALVCFRLRCDEVIWSAMAKEQTVSLEYDAEAEADALLREEDERTNVEMHKLKNGNPSERGSSLEDLEETEGLPPPATMAVNAVRDHSPPFPHCEFLLTLSRRLRRFIPLPSSVYASRISCCELRALRRDFASTTHSIFAQIWIVLSSSVIVLNAYILADLEFPLSVVPRSPVDVSLTSYSPPVRFSSLPSISSTPQSVLEYCSASRIFSMVSQTSKVRSSFSDPVQTVAEDDYLSLVSWDRWLKNIVPIGALFSASLIFSNLAYVNVTIRRNAKLILLRCQILDAVHLVHSDAQGVHRCSGTGIIGVDGVGEDES